MANRVLRLLLLLCAFQGSLVFAQGSFWMRATPPMKIDNCTFRIFCEGSQKINPFFSPFRAKLKNQPFAFQDAISESPFQDLFEKVRTERTFAGKQFGRYHLGFALPRRAGWDCGRRWRGSPGTFSHWGHKVLEFRIQF